MSDADEQEDMLSIVPYYRGSDETQQMVLRHGNAVVLYDKHSQQLSVTKPPLQDQPSHRDNCPTCGRPFEPRASSNGHGRSDAAQAAAALAQTRFIDQDYFRMLAASRRGSPSQTPAEILSRGLLQLPAGARSSRHVSSSSIAHDELEDEPDTLPQQARESISKSAFSPGFYKQFFVEKRELGRGGNGIVMLVEHKLNDTSLGEFACKRIPVGDDSRWLEKVLVEVKLLQGIPHQNLVRCHWVWLEDHQSSAFAPKIPCLWMLQEYCNGGDLQLYVIGPRESLSEAEKMKRRMRRRSKGEDDLVGNLKCPSKLSFEEIFSFFKDITSGLHHLHSRGYIHRDLKPSNCLIHQDGGRKRVLISDFGEIQAIDVTRNATGATGTISYCAPEVLRRDGPNGSLGDFTAKSDIFSLGMIVFFMCFGRLPYDNADEMNEENEDIDELRAEIAQWTGFGDELRSRSDLPEKLYRFLRRLLSQNPFDRPSTEEILSNIKAGIPTGEPVLPGPDDNLHRSNPTETKYRAQPNDKRQSPPLISRPDLSWADRRGSAQIVRSTSPVKRSSRVTGEHDHPATRRPHESSAEQLKEEQASTNSSGSAKAVPLSPRLLLPPPRSTLASRLQTVARIAHPAILPFLRLAVFIVKLNSIFAPCSPYAPSTWVLYSLLALAFLDVGIIPFEFRSTILLLGLHISIAALAFRYDRLCEVDAIRWAAF